MANDVKFITKETEGKKRRIPIIGRILTHEEKKREEQFQLNDENILVQIKYGTEHEYGGTVEIRGSTVDFSHIGFAPEVVPC